MPQIRCKSCDSWFDDTEDRCPYCGTVNPNYKKVLNVTPQTIGELKQWYADRKLPPEEVTRFFIGRDVREARAFGIYQDGPEYVVYKNKDDGSRVIRYRGTDEAYAVNELYLKLKSEILNQKSRVSGRQTKASAAFPFALASIVMVIASIITLTATGFFMPSVVLLVMGIALFVCVILFAKDLRKLAVSVAVIMFLSFGSMISSIFAYRSLHKHDGYYNHGNDYYYFQGHDVYHYDNDDWYYYDSYDDYDDFIPDYTYVSNDYGGYETYSDFSETEYYDDTWSSSSSSDNDSDFDWDGGSDWDSDGTDWGSDW